MGRTLRIIETLFLAGAITLGITNYLDRGQEQKTESSEQSGSQKPRFIGRTEEKTDGTLEQLSREGKLKDGTATYFNNGDFAVYVQGRFVYSKFNPETGRFDENPVSLSEIGKNSVRMISNPIENRDFDRN